MSATNANVKGASTPTFISALILGVVVFAAYMLAFAFLHGRFQGVYQPRTLLSPANKRPPLLKTGIIGWFTGVARTPDLLVFELNGADAYFFIRFLRLCILLFIPYWLLTWPILMTVSAVPPNGGQTGVSAFTFGNVASNHQIRHLAHLLVAVVLILYTLAMLYREYRHFMTIRRAYLDAPAHRALARSRTVMINDLPKSFLSAEAVRELAAGAGTVQRVWMPRKTKAMDKVFDKRNKECLKLEAGLGSVEATAAKNVRKSKNLPAGADKDAGAERGAGADPITRYVLPNDRPTHRLGSIPFIGKKVHTLEYSPDFIREYNEKLEVERARFADLPLANSAFVRFGSMAEAHAFAADIKRHAGSKLVGASVEVVPEDIVWGNLAMSPVSRKIKTIISWALTVGLIIIWAIPVAFAGSLSNISSLCNEVFFLKWICKLPKVVIGIIQGILPPVLLAVLFILLPIILRMWVKMQGEPRYSSVERKLFSRFWAFQVIHGFLVVTFASGLTSALQNISQTTSNLPTQLSKNLPNASIFFLTYIVVTPLSSVGSANARVAPLIISKYLRGFLGGHTPRKAFNFDWKMGSLALSTAWPPIALLACITISYSVIQPIITAFGAVGFILLYITYKYMLLYILDQPDYLETGGLFYLKALNTIFVALYLMEICLCGLFFLSKNANNKGISKMGIAGGVVMAVMIFVTAAVQIYLTRLAFSLRRCTYIGLMPGSGKTGSAEGLADTFSPAEAVGPTGATNGHSHSVNATDATMIANADADEAAGDAYGNTTGLHSRAFDPPSAWKPQPVVWTADDRLGIGRSEVARLEAMGVSASCAFAQMDESGKVIVERGPPGEAWYGGKTA